MNKKLVLVSLICIISFVGCAYKGVIKSDFYNTSPSSNKKIPLNILISENLNKLGDISTSDGYGDSYIFDAKEGMIHSTKVLLSEIFSNVDYVSAQQKDIKYDYLVETRFNSEVVERNDATAIQKFKITLALAFLDPVNLQELINITDNQTVIYAPTGKVWTLALIETFSLFTLAPIVHPMMVQSCGQHGNELIINGLNLSYKNLQKGVLEKSSILESKKFNIIDKPNFVSNAPEIIPTTSSIKTQAAKKCEGVVGGAEWSACMGLK